MSQTEVAVDPGTEFEPASAQVIPLGVDRLIEQADDISVKIDGLLDENRRLLAQNDAFRAALGNLYHSIRFVKFDGEPMQRAKELLGL